VHEESDLAFELLQEWKAEQYRRTRRLNTFDYDWVIELLDRIRTTQTAEFRGVLSVLYAGDRMAAVHLGIRSQRVLHWWFPTYSRELAQYSPGLILLTELAKETESLGVQRIDLGRGDERYKGSLSNGAFLIAEGAVDRRPVRRTVWRTWHACKMGIRNSRFRSVLEVPLNASRRLREWAMFR
jgi:CelD/BcsL family acetyltransferase involved in cellulose biosynthesis